jgi:hypothetical protein
MTELQIAYYEKTKDYALLLNELLSKKGYKTTFIQNQLQNPEGVILFLFDSNSKDIIHFFPWMREQNRNSTLPYLKILPIFFYHGKDIDPEAYFEETIQEVYEEIFSGEFKPFGFDLDSINPLMEFDTILDNYQE